MDASYKVASKSLLVVVLSRWEELARVVINV
jgi:hypothetical protein